MSVGNLYARLERLSPAQLLLAMFASVIFLGSLLLWLPFAAMDGVRVSYLEALFTAASAVCVTGLVVVDTGSTYSLTGQLILLALIQAGGLGIMTFASIGFKLVGAKLPLTHQMALEDSFYQRSAAEEFLHTFPRILKLLLLIQAAGFIGLSLGMLFVLPVGDALYSALFHTISAFCNAGFSIYSDSLTRFAGNPIVMFVTMALIVSGGLGYLVLVDLQAFCGSRSRSNEDRRPFRFTFHSRVVLLASVVLIAGGTIALLISGVRDGGVVPSLGAALFQSVTARTAGFNTVDIGSLPLTGLLIITILMFIGAAPGSCGGGIKVTSFVIWMARVRSALHGEPRVSLLGREIPTDLVLRAVAVIGLATSWNAMGVLLLSHVMPAAPLKEIVFEQISAFGTVGLSTGLTPLLPPLARVWIIATMFVGRLGPITLLFSFITKRTTRVKYAEGRVMIG
ncbi:MAG: TrkH family potassium uptake protein [Kiritimatiellia bacterium]